MSTGSSVVAIIILNWNGLADTLACLESLHGLEYSEYIIVVVDNGSVDDSCGVIRARFPEVNLIENRQNLGFAGGCNRGLDFALAAGADYVLLLNNDTIVDPDLLNEFVSAAQKFENKGIFSARILYQATPDSVWFGGAQWDEKTFQFNYTDEQDITRAAYACGCALFVPAVVAHRIGKLDERFFLTFEDVEWCYRARRMGLESYIVPRARVWHKVSASFGGERSPLAIYFFSRNFLLWAERYLGLIAYLQIFRFIVNSAAGFPPVRSSRLRHFFDMICCFLRHLMKKEQNLDSHAAFLGLKDYCLRRFGEGSEFYTLRH